MEELFYTAADDAKIAYWKTGTGEPLVLLHGSGESKELWERTGWLQALAGQYTVIAPDLRGFGHSTVYRDEEHYALERVLGDVDGVARACGAAQYRLFAHSYGATIGFQAVRAGLPIVRAVMASGSMDESFFGGTCPAEHAEYSMLAAAKRDGTLETLTQYTPEEIEFIKGEDMEKFSALFGAWSRWQPVKPGELAGKVSIYSGTKDFNAEMVKNTTERKAEFDACGIETACFEGLTHDDLIAKREACGAWVLEQLA